MSSDGPNIMSQTPARNRRPYGRSPVLQQRGFALIELLIVMAVLGLLAAIAVPQYNWTKEKANDAVVVSDMRRAMMSFEEHFVISGTYPPSMEAAGFQPSLGVAFTTWALENDGQSVHVDAEHVRSGHFYHLKYPEENAPRQAKKGTPDEDNVISLPDP